MKMKFEINKRLVPMKAHYFLWNAGTGPVVPYMSVYARQLGFSSVIVGLIYTILPIFGMIVKPTFGAIADRFMCQKKIFLVAQLLTAAAFLAIFYSPKVPDDLLVNFSCSNSEAVFHNKAETTIDTKLLEKIQSKNVLSTCQLDCQLSSGNLTTLCDNWNMSEYCDSSRQDLVNFTSVKFLASVPLAKTLLFNSSTHSIVEFRIGNITAGERVFNPVCTSAVRSSCGLECSDKDVDSLLLRSEIKDSDAYSTYQFWVFLLLMMTAWGGQAVAVSIGDAICFEMLGDKPNRYGYQRMFGALGWGLLSLLSGIIVDELSKDKSYNDYTASFYMAAGFLVLDFIVSCTLKYTQNKISTNIFKDVGKLLINIRIIVYLLWCIVVGMCTGLLWNFLLWLVEDLAKAQGETRIKTLQGVIMGVQCLGGELPFFFLSGRILKKIGHINAMSLVLFTLGIRFILYSVIDNPWWFIPVEFSNGLTFGVFYACMASYASIVAPSGTEATMQGMVGAVFEGVGVSMGSLLGGQALANVSGSLTFRYFGFGVLGACAVHVVAQYLIKIKGNADEPLERAMTGSTESTNTLNHEQ